MYTELINLTAKYIVTTHAEQRKKEIPRVQFEIKRRGVQSYSIQVYNKVFQETKERDKVDIFEAS